MDKYYIKISEWVFKSETAEIQEEIGREASESLLLTQTEVTKLESFFKAQCASEELLRIIFRYVEPDGGDFQKKVKNYPIEKIDYYKTNRQFIPMTFIEFSLCYFTSRYFQLYFFINRKEDYWFIELDEQRIEQATREHIITQKSFFRCDGFFALIKFFEHEVGNRIAFLQQEVASFKPILQKIDSYLEQAGNAFYICQVYKLGNSPVIEIKQGNIPSTQMKIKQLGIWLNNSGFEDSPSPSDAMIKIYRKK